MNAKILQVGVSFIVVEGTTIKYIILGTIAVKYNNKLRIIYNFRFCEWWEGRFYSLLNIPLRVS